MNVQVEKTKNKGSDQGLYPVGFKTSGALVDQDGAEIDDPLNIPKAGLFLRTEMTAFGDFPYQFGTDTVLTVRKVQHGKYNVETVSSVWTLLTI
jgi:hypothetical protein